ncbi:hypothetical protein JW824_00885, partial [bacterium]|nr:hypothetical protein [bacterium]
MNKIDLKFRLLLPSICLIMFAGGLHGVKAQELRWMKVGKLQCYFYDYGSEPEAVYSANDNNFFLTWPTLYGDNQSTMRAKGIWLGVKDFDDPVEKVNKSVKVIGIGPRLSANQFTMVFPQSIKLIARSQPPTVVVDQQIGTSNTLYDVPDEIDENLPCDRMIIIKFNTSIGVSVTKKIMAFTQQNHDDYFI